MSLAELGGGRRRLLRVTGIGITTLGVLLIAHFVWFPFDFVDSDMSIAEVLGRFQWSTGPLWHVHEVPSNVALFLLFGFGVGAIARSSSTTGAATCSLSYLKRRRST